MAELDSLREQISEIDQQIIDLFQERMEVSRGIAEYKLANKLPVLDSAREREKITAAMEAVPDGLRNHAAVLMSLLMETSRAQQHAAIRKETGSQDMGEVIRKALTDTPDLFPRDAFVACQGVEGAYSQIAADRFFKHPSISYFDQFEGVFRAVEQDLCDYGVLPVENSTAGSVNRVYDLMMKHDFHIIRTTRIKVDHNLIARSGVRLEDIREIYSHDQAIRQSQAFIDSLDNVTVHVCENTAAAARFVAQSERNDVAAICSRNCADLYDLEFLARNIQDTDNNYTRFACISKELEIYPGADRTSLMMITSHEPGALYKVLARFYALDINIVKLESRPIPERDFEFMFYFDLECPVAAPELSLLMETLDEVCEEYRYLGSYSEII